MLRLSSPAANTLCAGVVLFSFIRFEYHLLTIVNCGILIKNVYVYIMLIEG